MPEISQDYLEHLASGKKFVPVAVQPEVVAPEPIITPPIEANKTDIPVSAEPIPVAAPTATDWLSELRKNTGIDVNSVDDVKSYFDKALKIDDYAKRLEDAEREKEALRQKTEINPFANEREAKRNELLKAGASPDQINAFEKINQVDLSQVSPLEQMKLALQFREGLSEREANLYLSDKYKLDTEVYTPEEIERDQVRMKVEAKRDLEFLLQHKVNVSTVPADPREANERALREQEAVYIRNAEPVVNDILKNIEPFKGFSLNGKQGTEAETVDLPMSEGFKERIAPDVLAYAKAMRLDLNTNAGKEQLSSFIINLAKQQNFDNAVRHAAAERERKVRQSLENPSPLQRGPETGTAVEKSKFQEYQERLAAPRYRGR